MRRPEPNGRDDLAWLAGLTRFGIKPGLDRTRALLRAAGEPQRRFRTVLVGGTNGKGSTVTALAEMVSAAGISSGRFTSPHLHQLVERFWIDGRLADESALVAQVRALRPAAERVGATLFEVLTAGACLLFAEAGVDLAVFEVGLGGTFDATNALEPELSIVTNIGLDHVAVLGSSLEAIAADKAGIFRPDRPAFTAATGAALEVIRRRAVEIGADLSALGSEVQVAVQDLGWHGLDIAVTTKGHTLEGRTPLVGRHQGDNLGLAVAAAIQLGLSPEAIRSGLERVVWPGRLERFALEGRWLVLDAAHNPEGAVALAAALEHLEPEPVTVVFGASEDKDVVGMIAALRPQIRRLIATAASNPRALAADRLARLVAAEGSGAVETTLDRALEATALGGTVVVAGSLFLVAEVRAIVLRRSQGG